MRYIVILSGLLLTSCAGWDIFKTALTEEGAKVADEALKAAIWEICKGSPVGAVLREFNTPEKRDAYETLCKEELPVLRTAAM